MARILIVDDSPSQLMGMKRIVEKLGHEAITAEDGAAGVETAKAWKLLAGLNCDEIQGYFVAKPMPADTLADWLTHWQPPDTDDEVLATEFSAMLD